MKDDKIKQTQATYQVNPHLEPAIQFVVNSDGQRVAALLPLQAYEHYLDLLDDEADSHNPELAARLEQAAQRSPDTNRQSFRDYLRQRGVDNAGLQS